MVSDTLGLGRWIFKRYQGKHNLLLRVITTYRPFIANSNDVQTTYRQHQHYLDRKKYGRPPIQAILEDLCADIAQWRELGDQIFL